MPPRIIPSVAVCLKFTIYPQWWGERRIGPSREFCVLRKGRLQKLLAGALFAALAAHCAAAMTGQQPAPWALKALDATIASKLRQIEALKRDIEQADCEFATDEAGIEGCHQLEAKARGLAAEIDELKVRVGWTVAKRKAVEARRPYAAPPQPKAYTYRSRTDFAAAYRTLCVRLCDGFYYPVSEASRPGSFLAEEKLCRSTCAVPARLYYQPTPTADDANEMVSLTGERYADLPNAFRYRSEYLSACACGPKPWSADAKARYERRAMLAARTPLERMVAGGAAETANLLAEADLAVVAEREPRARSRAVRGKVQYSRGLFGRLRPTRYGLEARNEPAQRRFFLFRSR